MEDGEEIDLEAAVAARVDMITGVPPSTKIYAARQPTDRDVSALFLLDLSASTDARVLVTPAEGEEDAKPEEMRIIDILKEAVVLLSSALEEIGDTYAIYGFSSSGRKNVDVYPVKTFVETLSADVKGRISALAPQRSTRMGAAVRHATRKLKDLSTRGKVLILLSDGYPEDADYGRDPAYPCVWSAGYDDGYAGSGKERNFIVLHHRRQRRPRLSAGDVCPVSVIWSLKCCNVFAV